MGQIFSVTLNQMIVFFIFMLCGYLLAKLKIIGESAGGVISKLVVFVFLPAMCFNTFAANMNPQNIQSKLAILLWGTGLLAVCFLLAWGLSVLFAPKGMTRALYLYAFTIPNLGYLGYPLVSAVFGEQTLMDYMVFVLPFNLFIYTAGMYLLNPKREWTLKNLLNPAIISIVLGSIVGLLSIRMPSVVTTALNSASGCMGPLAMILSGVVLAKSPVLEMLRAPKMYIASAIRLIALPLLFGALLYSIGIVDKYIIMLACAALSLPMGLNNVVFPEAFGGDSKTGAQSCFISNVMGIFTIPFAYMFIERLFL